MGDQKRMDNQRDQIILYSPQSDVVIDAIQRMVSAIPSQNISGQNMGKAHRSSLLHTSGLYRRQRNL